MASTLSRNIKPCKVDGILGQGGWRRAGHQAKKNRIHARRRNLLRMSAFLLRADLFGAAAFGDLDGHDRPDALGAGAGRRFVPVGGVSRA